MIKKYDYGKLNNVKISVFRDKEREKNILLLELSNELNKNSLTYEELNTLSNSLFNVNKSIDKYSAIIISGGKENFSSGIDLKELVELTNMDSDEVKSDSEKEKMSEIIYQNYTRPGLQILEYLRGIGKYIPTISIIYGSCVGGGLEIALTCKIRLFYKNTTIGFPEFDYGFFPGFSGFDSLVNILGKEKAFIFAFSQKNKGVINQENIIKEICTAQISDVIINHNELCKYLVDFIFSLGSYQLSLVDKIYNSPLTDEARNCANIIAARKEVQDKLLEFVNKK